MNGLVAVPTLLPVERRSSAPSAFSGWIPSTKASISPSMECACTPTLFLPSRHHLPNNTVLVRIAVSVTIYPLSKTLIISRESSTVLVYLAWHLHVTREPKMQKLLYRLGEPNICWAWKHWAIIAFLTSMDPLWSKYLHEAKQSNQGSEEQRNWNVDSCYALNNLSLEKWEEEASDSPPKVEFFRLHIGRISSDRFKDAENRENAFLSGMVELHRIRAILPLPLPCILLILRRPLLLSSSS